MRTAFLTLALTGLADLSHADSSTTTVPEFWASFDDATNLAVPSYTSSAASVVSVNALETTYAVGCLDSAPSKSCSIKDDWTMIQGISTYSLTGVYTAFDWNPPVTVSLDQECTFTSWSVSASCSFSVDISGSADGVRYTSSVLTGISIPSDSISYGGMLVTGGLDKFDEPKATETPGVAGGRTGPAAALITAAPVLAAGVVAML